MLKVELFKLISVRSSFDFDLRGRRTKLEQIKKLNIYYEPNLNNS